MSRRGLTLLELVLALGLLSVLMVFVFALLDGALSVWERSEARRGFSEQATGVLDRLALDLRSLEGGERGDFLAAWVPAGPVRSPGEGPRDRLVPRLLLTRQAGAGEVARIGKAAPVAMESDLRGRLVEVAWALVADGEKGDPRGTIFRGERVAGADGVSFLEVGLQGDALLESLHEVSGDCLWLGFRFASQTSLLGDGFSIGDKLSDCSASWDGWGRGRPDAELTAWNLPAAGMPSAKDFVLLPRRVLIEIELESDRELKRRPRLAREVLPADLVLELDRALELPRQEGGDGDYLLVDEEWMAVTSASGNRASVRRAQRGTLAAPHAAGALAHFGRRLTRAVPIALHREDWNL
jgi:prepilin-type N-terminal cleavage/methylation domain-containing protein